MHIASDLIFIMNLVMFVHAAPKFANENKRNANSLPREMCLIKFNRKAFHMLNQFNVTLDELKKITLPNSQKSVNYRNVDESTDCWPVRRLKRFPKKRKCKLRALRLNEHLGVYRKYFAVLRKESTKCTEKWKSAKILRKNLKSIIQTIIKLRNEVPSYRKSRLKKDKNNNVVIQLNSTAQQTPNFKTNQCKWLSELNCGEVNLLTYQLLKKVILFLENWSWD